MCFFVIDTIRLVWHILIKYFLLINYGRGFGCKARERGESGEFGQANEAEHMLHHTVQWLI